LITPFQLDASANAPCTSTTVGEPALSLASDTGFLLSIGLSSRVVE
jgi:hypothetical protein